MLLAFEQRIRCPREVLFAFHSNPAHLTVLLRDVRGFRVLRHDGNIAPGSQTWTEQVLFGFLPVVLGFRHTVLDPPHAFEEEAIHGPFSRFVHRHAFEADGEGTILRDRLDVCVSLHYGGELALRTLLAPWIRRFFAFRHQALEELVAEGVVSRSMESR